MKVKIIILLIGLITTIGCSNDDNVQPNIEGQYVGTFQRNGNTSNVELSLDNGGFSGESEIVKFPAICNGIYSISNSTIAFENQCPWTAEFDWSLILSRTWNYSFTNNTLTLTNSTGDIYILTKQ